ncbi:Uncharacterised protein [Vibrio cholerae]|nr:Uncharacterised protein [Vibrio cholerae]
MQCFNFIFKLSDCNYRSKYFLLKDMHLIMTKE